MKTIYFVRHGESESNVKGIMSGSKNDVGLTQTGRQQAKSAGQKLAAYDVQLIVSSPMARTVATAEIIAAELGYDSKSIVKNPLFTERGLGVYDGRPRADYEKDLAAGTVHNSIETEEQMYDRFHEALEWLKGRKEERIVVVSHGGARRAVHVINENLHPREMYNLERFGNGEIYEFTL